MRICGTCTEPTDIKLGALYSTDSNCARCGQVVGLGSVVMIYQPIIHTPRSRKSNGHPQ